jgi:hypothetical protein
VLLTTNYCLWIAASAAAELAPIANSTSGIQSRAVASVKADANRFAKNVAPIIREIQSTGVGSHRGISRSLNARGVTTARGGVWTTVQVGSILRRVGHFASGRSIKQQTNNKQQAKLTPSRQRLKVVSPLPMPFDRTVTWRQFVQ